MFSPLFARVSPHHGTPIAASKTCRGYTGQVMRTLAMETAVTSPNKLKPALGAPPSVDQLMALYRSSLAQANNADTKTDELIERACEEHKKGDDYLLTAVKTITELRRRVEAGDIGNTRKQKTWWGWFEANLKKQSRSRAETLLKYGKAGSDEKILFEIRCDRAKVRDRMREFRATQPDDDDDDYAAADDDAAKPQPKGDQSESSPPAQRDVRGKAGEGAPTGAPAKNINALQSYQLGTTGYLFITERGPCVTLGSDRYILTPKVGGAVPPEHLKVLREIAATYILKKL